jgi:hypothetical protein
MYGAETLFMGSFHDPDPSMGSRGLDRLSARRTATLWIVVSHTWAFPDECELEPDTNYLPQPKALKLCLELLVFLSHFG